MTNDVLKQIWPEWEIEETPLGRGSFGVVYKAVRKDHNVESYAAIKVISIPSDPSEVDSLRSDGLDINATKTFLHNIVDDFVNEIQLMESLKGVQNIVSVEDYKVVEKNAEIGWDIYIRMELLTPFNKYTCDKKLTEKEVIKLGCDICTALEICGKRNIIHRDIKPENIFINDFGDFKLGDFGIARKLENMTGGLSQKGTFNYMAPEVATGSKYDSRVDTYSLGIVLYRLLNGNRLPFLDTEKQLLNPNERRNAIDRRLQGEVLPPPCEASAAMADVILRACSYDPNMRFSSATEMKQALMSVANGTCQTAAASTPNAALSVCKVSAISDRQDSKSENTAAEAGDPNDATSLLEVTAVSDNPTVKLLNNAAEVSDPDGTISVRRAPDTSDRQAEHKVDTFGPASDDDENKRKKTKKIIVIASSAGAACLALVLTLVLLPKVINAPKINTAEENISSMSEESAIHISSSDVSSSPSTAVLSSYSYTTSSSEPVVAPEPQPAGTVTILGQEYDIATTTELDLSGHVITDEQLKQIAPELEKLANLTSLTLWDNQISDITPLANLTNLTNLNLDLNKISNITPLANLTNLTSLDLRYNQISDITPLANLTNLTNLNLDLNKISNITPLANLTNLTELDLDLNKISNITPLANLTNLTNLNLNENQSSDITPLTKLTNLTWLGLYGNQISDITPLENLTKMTDLNLNNNRISDITPLTNLTNLTYLGLSENQISDITLLANFTKLTKLVLVGDQISNITPLAKLSNLTFLNLNNNEISDITLLANLTNLTDLDLQDNQISDITPLANLSNLTMLDLQRNQVSEEDKVWLRQQLPNCDIFLL